MSPSLAIGFSRSWPVLEPREMAKVVNHPMENGPFIDGLPINGMVIFHGYVK